MSNQVSQLGIREGGALFVHISLKAVDPGLRPEDLIRSLQEAIGPEGTLLVPTFTSRQERVFDPDNTPSAVGVVTEVFRNMPGTLRSLHPRHPVAAAGPRAAELLEGHERAIGPCGEGTPFERHAKAGGQILLVGVDLDALTLLHTAEAYLDLAYLTEMEGSYLDKDGAARKVAMRHVPGGHRGGVRLFEKLFNQRGLIRYGRIGKARTMLMDAGPVLDTMVELLRNNPMAALCPHDNCPDCVDRKGMVRARQLADLGAELSLVLPALPEKPELFTRMLTRFGAPPHYFLRDNIPVVRVPAGERPPPPPDDKKPWVLQPAPCDLLEMKEPPAGYKGFAYAPLDAADSGIQPFYSVLYKAKCRDYITDIFVEDGITDLAGCGSPRLDYLAELVPDDRVVLGSGHAQLREIVSALRMRSFSGHYHLIVPPGNIYTEALRVLREFWALIPN